MRCHLAVAVAASHPRPFSQWEKGGRETGLRSRSLALLVPPAMMNAIRMDHHALPTEGSLTDT